MRAADLDDVVPGLGFAEQHLVEALESGDQLLGDGLSDGDVDGGGEHVVGRLPHVDVVVGVDRLLLGEAVAAGQLDGAVADDLVDVHVRRGSRASLVDVDGELVVMLAGDDFAGRIDDRLGEIGFELAQIAVGGRGGDLDQAESANEFFRKRLAGDGEVLDGALRLGAVVRLGRHLHLAHRIFLDAELGHRGGLQRCVGSG
jgi:hypothetical protein